MNFLIRMFLAALVLVAPCWVAQVDASGCYINRNVVYSNYPYVVKKEVVVEKQVLVASLVPVVVAVPAYPVQNVVNGYAQAQVTQAQQVAQAYPPQPQGQAFDVNALNSVLTRINERLTTIETSIQGGVSASGQQAAQANDVVRVFAAKCGDCHGQAPKGNTFGFVDKASGQLAQLTDRQLGKIQNRVFRSKEDKKVMPPTGHPPLDDRDVGLIGAWIEAKLAGAEAQGQPPKTDGGGAPEQMTIPPLK